MSEALAAFEKLYAEFEIGTRSLNYHMAKGAGKTPFFQAEKERFFKRICDPMDAAWLRLTDEDRKTFESRIGAKRKTCS